VKSSKVKPHIARHTALNSQSIASSSPSRVELVQAAGELADAGQAGAVRCEIGHEILHQRVESGPTTVQLLKVTFT
jgi:hypothetical protein